MTPGWSATATPHPASGAAAGAHSPKRTGSSCCIQPPTGPRSSVLFPSRLLPAQPDDQASQCMQEAWALVFGREPNLSDAWGRAIKAIETLLKPIVSPSDVRATLGKMISVLRQSPDKWECKLPDRVYNVNGEINSKRGIEVFIDALATIGYQPDRHGSDQPQDVDEATARSVLFLATTIVGWLRDGILRTVDSIEN